MPTEKAQRPSGQQLDGETGSGHGHDRRHGSPRSFRSRLAAGTGKALRKLVSKGSTRQQQLQQRREQGELHAGKDEVADVVQDVEKTPANVQRQSASISSASKPASRKVSTTSSWNDSDDDDDGVLSFSGFRIHEQGSRATSSALSSSVAEEDAANQHIQQAVASFSGLTPKRPERRTGNATENGDQDNMLQASPLDWDHFVPPSNAAAIVGSPFALPAEKRRQTETFAAFDDAPHQGAPVKTTGLARQRPSASLDPFQPRPSVASQNIPSDVVADPWQPDSGNGEVQVAVQSSQSNPFLAAAAEKASHRKDQHQEQSQAGGDERDTGSASEDVPMSVSKEGTEPATSSPGLEHSKSKVPSTVGELGVATKSPASAERLEHLSTANIDDIDGAHDMARTSDGEGEQAADDVEPSSLVSEMKVEPAADDVEPSPLASDMKVEPAADDVEPSSLASEMKVEPAADGDDGESLSRRDASSISSAACGRGDNLDLDADSQRSEDVIDDSQDTEVENGHHALDTLQRELTPLGEQPAHSDMPRQHIPNSGDGDDGNDVKLDDSYRANDVPSEGHGRGSNDPLKPVAESGEQQEEMAYADAAHGALTPVVQSAENSTVSASNGDVEGHSRSAASDEQDLADVHAPSSESAESQETDPVAHGDVEEHSRPAAASDQYESVADGNTEDLALSATASESTAIHRRGKMRQSNRRGHESAFSSNSGPEAATTTAARPGAEISQNVSTKKPSPARSSNRSTRASTQRSRAPAQPSSTPIRMTKAAELRRLKNLETKRKEAEAETRPQASPLRRGGSRRLRQDSRSSFDSRRSSSMVGISASSPLRGVSSQYTAPSKPSTPSWSNISSPEKHMSPQHDRHRRSSASSTPRTRSSSLVSNTTEPSPERDRQQDEQKTRRRLSSFRSLSYLKQLVPASSRQSLFIDAERFRLGAVVVERVHATTDTTKRRSNNYIDTHVCLAVTDKTLHALADYANASKDHRVTVCFEAHLPSKPSRMKPVQPGCVLLEETKFGLVLGLDAVEALDHIEEFRAQTRELLRAASSAGSKRAATADAQRSSATASASRSMSASQPSESSRSQTPSHVMFRPEDPFLLPLAKLRFDANDKLPLICRVDWRCDSGENNVAVSWQANDSIVSSKSPEKMTRPFFQHRASSWSSFRESSTFSHAFRNVTCCFKVDGLQSVVCAPSQTTVDKAKSKVTAILDGDRGLQKQGKAKFKLRVRHRGARGNVVLSYESTVPSRPISVAAVSDKHMAMLGTPEQRDGELLQTVPVVCMTRGVSLCRIVVTDEQS